MNNPALERRFKAFCKGLSAKDRVAILHHSDADGFCSALIAAKAVKKLSDRKPVAVMPYEYGNKAQEKKARSLIKAKKANTLIVVDLGLDSTEKGLEIFPFEKGILIDHHKMYKDLNSPKLVFLKAQFFTKRDASGYAASKFAFDLFGRVADIDECDWLACIGILGDMSLKNWKSFVQKTVKKRNVSVTWFYRFLDLIASVEVLSPKRMPELFWEFYNAEKPADLLESRFSRYLKKFKAEKDALVEGFDSKAEKFPEIELYFYSIRSKHESIKSYVINEISELHPNKTIVLMQFLKNGRVRFSARRQDFKVRVNDLLSEAVKGIPDSGAGGHVPAAAGNIPRQHLSRFKKNVVEILERKYSK